MEPDQLASKKPADLDLHCFQNRIYLGLRLFGLWINVPVNSYGHVEGV